MNNREHWNGFPLQFTDVITLARELPWFTLDEDNRPRLAVDLGYGFIDCHAHLANNYFLAGAIDFWRLSPSSRTFFYTRGNAVDLSVYSGVNLAQHDKTHKKIVGEFAQTAITNKGHHMPHHSAANMLRDMDAAGISHTVLLAIDFPVVSRNSDHALGVHAKNERLVPFICVHPADPLWRRKLERYLEQGARGMKIHPELQGVAIDSPLWRPILKRWEQTGLPILSHSSVSPVQPDAIRGEGKVARSDVSRFFEVAERFPGIPLLMGHGGMNDYRTVIALAKKFPNVVAELDGQPPAHLQEYFEQVDPAQLVWGTDWPVYPQIYQLAKLLIATEGDPGLRYQVLHASAARLLGLPVAAPPRKDRLEAVGGRR